MDDRRITYRGGLSLTTVLTGIFVTLKLCGVIKWGWIWVFCPIWIEIGLLLLVLVILGPIALYLGHKEKKEEEERFREKFVKDMSKMREEMEDDPHE